MDKKAFYNAYHKTFEVVRVNTDALRARAFRLRYEVFCLENWLIDPNVTPGKIERDVYDRMAEHILLVHRDSGEAIGTARVNFVQENHPAGRLPLQDLCDHPVLHAPHRAASFCEISRVCMSSNFRRRQGDGRLLPTYHEPQIVQVHSKMPLFRRRIPYAPLGLIGAAFALAVERGVVDCVWVMDPDELHGLQEIGMDYKVLGPRLENYGGLQPIIFNVAHVLAGMKDMNEPCWEIVSDRGRLSRMAPPSGTREEWHDAVFDRATKERIYQHLQ